MTSENYDDIFSAYYTLYRNEASVPSSSDDEYTIGMRLANEALSRWANYDGTYWKDLFDTNQNDGSGSQTIVTGTTKYSGPSNMREAGGIIKIKNSSGNTVRTYPIIQPEEAQFKGAGTEYAYFTNSPLYYNTGTASQSGSTITGVGTTWTADMVGMQFVFVTGESATITAFSSTTSLTVSVSRTIASSAYRILTKGFTLNISPAPDSSINGMDIDYVYYKKPTLYTSGSSRSEIPDPYFVVHRMLANRFRSSRNPYYSSAFKDAEEALKVMQFDNNSGTWADPWKLADNSGSNWGS